MPISVLVFVSFQRGILIINTLKLSHIKMTVWTLFLLTFESTVIRELITKIGLKKDNTHGTHKSQNNNNQLYQTEHETHNFTY